MKVGLIKINIMLNNTLNVYIYIYIQSAYKSINLIIITGISVQRNFYHLELI